jgi:hypothetical protein
MKKRMKMMIEFPRNLLSNPNKILIKIKTPLIRIVTKITHENLIAERVNLELIKAQSQVLKLILRKQL